MKNRLSLFSIIITLLLLVPISQLHGQKEKVFKRFFRDADYLTLTEEHTKAQGYYEEMLELDPENSNLHYLYGNCLYIIGNDIAGAISHLEESVKNINIYYREGSYKETSAPPISSFLLAKAYHIDNQFEKAINSYKLYKKNLDMFQFAEIEYVNRQIKACGLAMAMVSDPIDVFFKTVAASKEEGTSFLNPVISGNDSIMFYVEKSNKGNTIVSISNLGDAWTEPRAVDVGLEGNYFPVTVSNDGRELYIVMQDYYESNIYVSRFDGSEWSWAESLNGNINTRYYESHASISADGNVLYFTSNRKDGWGGLDIYRSERDPEGDWQPAANLGFTINTYYNEETPFISANDSVLYFSSEGFSSMGGYDVFYATLDSEGDWSNPKNLGYPISTPGDDLFYNPGRGRLSYYAMRSDKEQEGTDIFSVELRDGDWEETDFSYLDNYMSLTNVVSSESFMNSGETSGGELPDHYYIQNIILFDFDDYSLNEAALTEAERLQYMMQKYPEISIELTGHTDSKGSVKYNEKLSRKRAQSVAKYLTSNGISPDRISVTAIGENEPIAINQFDDGKDAPGGRVLNRNVSIKISEMSREKIRMTEIFVPDRLIPVQDRVYSIMLMESDGLVDSIPEKIMGETVSMIMTDESNLYTLGNFEQQKEATDILNELIDNGYPDAYVMEKKGFENTIRNRTSGEKYKPLNFIIQIMALKNPVPPTYFKNLENVEDYVGKDGYHRYVFGSFDNINEATLALGEVHAKGYHDAFVKQLEHYKNISVE